MGLVMSPPGRSSSSSAAWRDRLATITLALVLVVGVVAAPVWYVGEAIEREDAFVVVAGDELRWNQRVHLEATVLTGRIEMLLLRRPRR